MSNRCHQTESCQFTHRMIAQHHSLYVDNTDKHVDNPQHVLAHDQTCVCGKSEIGCIPENEKEKIISNKYKKIVFTIDSDSGNYRRAGVGVYHLLCPPKKTYTQLRV